MAIMTKKFERQDENEAGITRRLGRLLIEGTFASSAVQMESNALHLTWGDGTEYVITVEQVGGRNQSLFESTMRSIRGLGGKISKTEASS